jgi:hypothetical protein
VWIWRLRDPVAAKLVSLLRTGVFCAALVLAKIGRNEALSHTVLQHVGLLVVSKKESCRVRVRHDGVRGAALLVEGQRMGGGDVVVVLRDPLASRPVSLGLHRFFGAASVETEAGGRMTNDAGRWRAPAAA